ncbi:MAG: hypothetical protein OEM43_04095 [Gammaproteobacteria bacterium]|nr:hypothetical protein [Gammaproteobacteria bacterium]
MKENTSNRKVVILRAVFLIGAVADGLIAIEWFLVSLGLIDMPIYPSYFVGSGQDYQFVLSIAGLFMMGWALLMYWGSLQPVERRGILLLTATMLFIAILSDGLVFGHLLTDRQIIMGTSAKLFLVILFAGTYWYSKRSDY